MDRRIHQALDGELPREDLPQMLAAELNETEATMGRVVSAIPEEPLSDLSSAVMRRIHESRIARQATGVRTAPARDSGRNRKRGALHWLWAPRPLQWRPIYALAAAAMLVVAVFGSRSFDDGRPVPVATEPTPIRVFVQFRFEAPEANAVMLAGDFTQWRPAHVLRRSADGVWTVVVPVEPGVHEYAFVVDGDRWVPDPYAPAVSDGFGGVNSRLAILTPDAQRPL